MMMKGLQESMVQNSHKTPQERIWETLVEVTESEACQKEVT
jgi:hypothetical protein